MTKYDVAVVGAGPAGSTTAYHLSKAGARVLLIDRARFPRDKPCGGGVTARALAEAPVDLTPMVEQVVDRVRFSYKLGDHFDYTYPRALVYMTQRHKLDAFLVEQAREAGADFHDGAVVRKVELTKTGTQIGTEGGDFEADVLVGADGSNGIVARSIGLTPVHDPPVALEANFLYPEGREPAEWQGLLALELGSMAGGYGWSFPKSDHFNVGCGGWSSEGGRLREHLVGLKHHYGLDSLTMENVRGHHLPTRGDGTAITRGRALLVGDAAGLVDPISGEGIYSAFLSGRLAAQAIGPLLAGKTPDLWSYEAAIEKQMMGEMRAAALLRDIYHYTPRPCYEVLKRSEFLRRSLCQLITGEKTYSAFVKDLTPVMPLLRFWAARGRAARTHA